MNCTVYEAPHADSLRWSAAPLPELIDRLAGESDLVLAIRSGARLLRLLSATVPSAAHAERVVSLLVGHRQFHGDVLFRSFALRALGRLHNVRASDALLEMLLHGDSAARSHAAWAVQGTLQPRMVEPVVALLQDDGFGRMAAMITLCGSCSIPAVRPRVSCYLQQMAADTDQVESARVTAIQCLARGFRHRDVLSTLRTLASDANTCSPVRSAALRALGDLQDGASRLYLEQVVRHTDQRSLLLAAVEALGDVGDRTSRTLLDQVSSGLRGDSSAEASRVRDAVHLSMQLLSAPVPGHLSGRKGLSIAQVAVQGSLDRHLRNAGEGDGGGLATLLIDLAGAFAMLPDVDHIHTVGRATQPDTPLVEAMSGSGAHLVRIPFGPDAPLQVPEMWPHVFTIERGLRRYFATQPTLDAMHLRFSDAGTWAAARWAHGNRVPIHFTLAPDPYVPIRSAQRAGMLDRATFGSNDARVHYLFRAHLLDWMVEHAAGLALLPRPDWERDAREFFDLDPYRIGTRRGAVRVIAEGINVRALNRPPHSATVQGPPVPGWLESLPPHRRHLPLLLSVGRLHPVKGMARVVAAWAADPMLQQHFNLVIVGGKLTAPSSDEETVLRDIAAQLRIYPDASAGLILAGSHAHGDVATIMAAVSSGVPGYVAPNGIYVCPSDKEEFGLAILEAMAAGLLVVAPNQGGPATYLTEGEAGFPVNTRSIEGLRAGIHAAADLRLDPGRRDAMIAHQQLLVEARYSIDRMARELVELYRDQRPALEFSAS